MANTTTAEGVEVWVDEGHGRLGIIDVLPLGYAIASVSANDGRVVGGFIDDLYKPAHGALGLASLLDLEGGQRVFFRTEAMRKDGVDPTIPIRDLADEDVTRHFVTLTILPDGVDEPPQRPQPKTRPVPNEDTPPPPPPRPKRYGPSHRDGWDYNAVFGCVLHAYQDLDDDTCNPAAVKALAWATLTAADMVQQHLEDHCDRKSYAHARARAAAHTIVARHPCPLIAEPSVKRGWLVGVALTAAALLRVADDLGGWA